MISARTLIQAKALHPQILTSVLSSSSSSKQLTNAWEDIYTVLKSLQNEREEFRALSPALWVAAASPRSSARRSLTPTLFLSGLSAASKRHGDLLSSGCIDCSGAEQQQPHLGHRSPGPAPSKLTNTRDLLSFIFTTKKADLYICIIIRD